MVVIRRRIVVWSRETSRNNLSAKSSGHQFVGASEFWGSGLGVSFFLSFFGRAASSCCAFNHSAYFGSSGLGGAELGRPPIQVGIKSEIVAVARDFTSRRPSSRTPHPPKPRAMQRIRARGGHKSIIGKCNLGAGRCCVADVLDVANIRDNGGSHVSLSGLRRPDSRSHADGKEAGRGGVVIRHRARLCRAREVTLSYQECVRRAL